MCESISVPRVDIKDSHIAYGLALVAEQCARDEADGLSKTKLSKILDVGRGPLNRVMAGRFEIKSGRLIPLFEQLSDNFQTGQTQAGQSIPADTEQSANKSRTHFYLNNKNNNTRTRRAALVELMANPWPFGSGGETDPDNLHDLARWMRLAIPGWTVPVDEIVGDLLEMELGHFRSLMDGIFDYLGSLDPHEAVSRYMARVWPVVWSKDMMSAIERLIRYAVPVGELPKLVKAVQCYVAQEFWLFGRDPEFIMSPQRFISRPGSDVQEWEFHVNELWGLIETHGKVSDNAVRTRARNAMERRTRGRYYRREAKRKQDQAVLDRGSGAGALSYSERLAALVAKVRASAERRASAEEKTEIENAATELEQIEEIETAKGVDQMHVIEIRLFDALLRNLEIRDADLFAEIMAFAEEEARSRDGPTNPNDVRAIAKSCVWQSYGLPLFKL